MTRVLVIDNYDSFTYNLVQFLGELGARARRRAQRRARRSTSCWSARPDRVVVSPGPCTPDEAGISVEAMRRFPEAGVRTLGVCLGHQSLAQAFGGRVDPPRARARQDDDDRARRAHDLRRASTRR